MDSVEVTINFSTFILISNIDGTKLVIDKETGFYNISKVLEQIEYKKYNHLKTSNEYKKQYEIVKNEIGCEPLLSKHLHSDRSIRGYYLHRDLLLYIVGLKSFSHICKYVSFLDEFNNLKSKKDFNQKLNDVILESNVIIDNLKTDNSKLKKSNKKLKKQNKDLEHINSQIMHNTIQMKNKLASAQSEFKAIIDDIKNIDEIQLW